jgi:hypothetical protein
VVVLSIAAAMYPSLFLVLLPIPYDSHALHLLYKEENMPKNTNTGPMPELIEIGPSQMQDLSEIFTADGTPKVAYRWFQPDGDEVIRKLKEANKGRTVRGIHACNEEHFSPSCGKFVKPTFDIACDDFIQKSMIDESDRCLYAGFEAVTDMDAVEDIIGMKNMTGLGNYKMNNLFMSNFATQNLASPSHCAPIDSVVIQLVGTKTWIFNSPEQLATVHASPMPTFFNYPMSDDELLAQYKDVKLLVTGPGDVMYFGPAWCHAVVSEAGPNVMFNIRYMAGLRKLWRTLPINLFTKVMLMQLFRRPAKIPQDNVWAFGPIYKALLGFMDCGPSNKTAYLKDSITKFLESVKRPEIDESLRLSRQR